MNPRQGNLIYKLILKNPIEQVLELGTAHGVGACYMAAALAEKKKGKVLTIDNKLALERNPNPIELIKKNGLKDYVNPVFAESTYNWELMKIIERQTSNGICTPIFDFCYIDGAHNFEVDCCAFHLVDKLLKPGGWILFDDLNWTYADSPTLKDTEWVRNMAEEERTTPHVKKIVELVVKTHPGYTEESYFNDWVIVRKLDQSGNDTIRKIDLQKMDLKRNKKFEKFLNMFNR